LIAWRVPEEQANRRRQKLCEEMKRKNKKAPGAERLAWCDWSILLTNVPAELLTPTEAAVLYRARWQIELLFIFREVKNKTSASRT
jgi:IS4 transposase